MDHWWILSDATLLLLAQIEKDILHRVAGPPTMAGHYQLVASTPLAKSRPMANILLDSKEVVIGRGVDGPGVLPIGWLQA